MSHLSVSSNGCILLMLVKAEGNWINDQESIVRVKASGMPCFALSEVSSPPVRLAWRVT